MPWLAELQKINNFFGQNRLTSKEKLHQAEKNSIGQENFSDTFFTIMPAGLCVYPTNTCAYFQKRQSGRCKKTLGKLLSGKTSDSSCHHPSFLFVRHALCNESRCLAVWTSKRYTNLCTAEICQEQICQIWSEWFMCSPVFCCPGSSYLPLVVSESPQILSCASLKRKICRF